MSRLIDADVLMDLYAKRLELLGERYWPNSSECGVLAGAMKLLEAQPTIEERKPGKWEIYVISPFDGEGCRCSECKYEGAPYWDFCPNCGAEMRAR